MIKGMIYSIQRLFQRISAARQEAEPLSRNLTFHFPIFHSFQEILIVLEQGLFRVFRDWLCGDFSYDMVHTFPGRRRPFLTRLFLAQRWLFLGWRRWLFLARRRLFLTPRRLFLACRQLFPTQRLLFLDWQWIFLARRRLLHTDGVDIRRLKFGLTVAVDK